MFLDLLYPKFCSGCGRLGKYICPICAQHLQFMDKTICFYCEKDSDKGLTHPWCNKKFGIDGYMTTFRYNTTLKKVLKTIKYRLVTDSWKELFRLMDRNMFLFNRFKELVSEAVLVPIPLYRKRLLQRGFNQAEVVADYFSIKLGYPMEKLMEKTVSTTPQAQLPRNERCLNLSGAFRIVKSAVSIPNLVILVDDVVTTGSTMGEAAHILKKAGVKKVFGFSVAKG